MQDNTLFFFNGTKVMLNLTHLQLTESIISILFFLIYRDCAASRILSYYVRIMTSDFDVSLLIFPRSYAMEKQILGYDLLKIFLLYKMSKANEENKILIISFCKW